MEIVLERYLILSSSFKPPLVIVPRPNALNSSVLVSRNGLINYVKQRGARIRCNAIRRKVRYDEDEGEEYRHNEEIATLEMYSQSASREVLLVNALLDGQEVQVIIFKGFSSCLSYATSPDPSKSVLPARAVIKSIDRIKGPFDPTNIEYLQKGVAWEEFKSKFLPS